MTDGSRGSVFRSIQTLYEAGSFTGMTDAQLVEQFLARQDEVAEAAFTALVTNHGPMVWRVCRGVLSDVHAAEDAFQATFLILMRKAGSIRRRETLAPWLYGVARRVAVRAKATAARRRIHESQGAEREPTLMADLSDQEEQKALHEELDRLPEKYRAAVVLCDLEGRTHAEAARLLRCPAGTVSTRVSRARELLRKRLMRRGVALSAAAGLALGPEPAWAGLPVGLAESTIKAVMQVAAGKAMTAGVVPAMVAELTEGVLRTMRLTKLTFGATALLAGGLVSTGIGLYAMSKPPAQLNPGAEAVSTTFQAEQAQEQPGEAAAPRQEDEQEARNRSMNNLKMLGLAMHNYASTGGGGPTFPPAAISKDGKPLLSWRVALLPHLEQKVLYDKFHLDEAWDSPHNKTLLDQIPAVYAPVITKKDDPKGNTYYQVFFGKGALFEGNEGTRFAAITDGTSNTLMVAEASTSVPWTKPEDLPFDKDKPLPKLGGQFEDGFTVVFADCSGKYIKKSIDDQVLRALITRNGGEVIPADQ